MKPLQTLFIASATGIATLMTANAAVGLVDNFSDLTLTEYTQTRVLDNGASAANVSFSASTGALFASYSGTNAAEQVVLLRDDISLAVGETLTVDVSQAITTSEMDFGIAVAATKTPTSIVNGGDLDTRDTMQWASIYVRPNQNAVRSLSYNGTTLDSGTGILTAVENTVSKLWIKRDTSTSFILGYTNTSAVDFTSKTVTLSSSVGTAIGFYADLRANGGNLGGLDNLTIIPEPSSSMLGLLFGAGFLVRRRR
jgi:hypothetical protein